MEESRQRYRMAYDAWLEQLIPPHGVLLEGSCLDALELKGLPNREALVKERYDNARRELLGLSG